MTWRATLKAITEAISVYRQRNEPVPEVLMKVKASVETTTQANDKEVAIDIEDLTQLFLQMAGWHG